uniref:Tachykinin precursor 4 n=1 Tax=Maylandia zebra TaxID=106582 RepID=A0A3P9DDL0_9CICH
METLKFVVVMLVVVLVQVCSALGTPLSGEENDGEMWTVEDWQGYPVERGITIRLADLIKRSKAQQFHGLMGRSSGEQINQLIIVLHGNKGEMFVGLMGRRSLGGGKCPATATSICI